VQTVFVIMLLILDNVEHEHGPLEKQACVKDMCNN